MSIIINNAKIFDGTGKGLFSGSIEVEDGRIKTLQSQSIEPQAGDRVLDANGKILMPGLVDVHTHLGLGSTIEAINPPGNHSDEEAALIIAHAGRVMLDHGFTSGFSGGSGSVKGEIAARKAFDRGLLPGPRLITSSFERLPGGTPGLIFKFPEHNTRDCHPEAVVEFVNVMADLGVQAVKFLLNGVSAMDPGTNYNEQFYDEEIMAAADAARDRGIWLTAHCYTAHSVKLAIKAGFRTLYHLTFADDEALDMVEANKDKLYIGPTPGIVEADMVRGPQFGVMKSDAQRAEQAELVENTKRVGTELRKRGAKCIPGGDYGFPWNPIGTNARDLELFVEWFGYTPLQTLHAATQLGGEAMGMGEELGQIKQGFLADLLLVDGDPTEDLSVLNDKNRLVMIMKDGRFHKAPQGLSVCN